MARKSSRNAARSSGTGAANAKSQGRAAPRQAAEPVRAHVVLRGRGGLSASDAGVTAQNLEAVIAEPSTVERARQFLEQHGFAIHRVSPTSIIVEGSPMRYRDVFGTAPERLDDASAGARPTYAWSASPRIPSDLKDVVADVVLPRRAALY